eukprot:TRINITY_DN60764_c0_g1_i1.p1 TRINITY_DN60764_c0_g1~~TRINITY_DN60764_c0_g1_i1.p1  ORF type:complete len:349 (+),score=45.87 TRINITY_DN60764_c0_g1_i1:116-1162(+)
MHCGTGPSPRAAVGHGVGTLPLRSLQEIADVASKKRFCCQVEANRDALLRWAATVQRTAFNAWRSVSFGVSRPFEHAIVDASVRLSMRRVRAGIWKWKHFHSTAHASAKGAEAKRQILTGMMKATLVFWKHSAAARSDLKLASTLTKLRKRRCQLQNAIVRWHGCVTISTARSTYPLRAAHFNLWRLLGPVVRAWLLLLLQRAGERTMAAMVQQALRPRRVTCAFAFWRKQAALSKDARLLSRRSRRFFVKCLFDFGVVAWRTYVEACRVKVKLRLMAAQHFAVIARHKAIQKLVMERNRRVASRLTLTASRWVSNTSTLLPFVRRWAATIYASRQHARRFPIANHGK